MQFELHGDREQAEEIRALIENWDAALAQQDAHGLSAQLDQSSTVYDIGAQFVGAGEYRDQWIRCFPYFGDSVRIERRKPVIHAADGMAFFYCYTRVSGASTPPPAELPWCRLTVCYRKVDGDWRVAHEHASVPYDFGRREAALILGEP